MKEKTKISENTKISEDTKRSEDTKISEDTKRLEEIKISEDTKISEEVKISEDTKISEEISKLRLNIAKIEEIVNKANVTKGNKRTLLKEAKEGKFLPKSEIKKFSTNIGNFDKIAIDKGLIKKAKSKLIKLELEMALKEYTTLQDEYAKTYSEIESQITQ